MKQIDHLAWDFIVVIGGVLLTLSFSPFDYSFFAVVAMTLLFISWQGISPKRALVRGFLFGSGLFGSGLYWVFISVYDYGGAGLATSVLLTLIFVVFWAIFPALSAYICVKFFKIKRPLIRMIVFPTIWLLIEYIRGQVVFNGFPWFQLAYSQLDTPLSGFVPVLGVYGSSWFTALIASALALVFTTKQKHYWLCFTIITCTYLSGWLLTKIKWTYPVGEPFKATMIQGNISQDKKWQPEYRKEIMQLYKEMTLQHWDSRLIIWPESAVPVFYKQARNDYLLPLEAEAKEHNVDLVVSLPIKNEQGEKFNAVMTLGSNQAVYHKIHLLPFGEYLPLQPFSGWLLNSLNILPVGSFTAGKRTQPLLKAAGHPFSISICYEDAFGEESMRLLSESSYMINLTNDGWFGDSIEPYQHMQIARMRALEAGRFLLRSTNTGLTAVVAPTGKIVASLPLFRTTSLTALIQPMAGITAYARHGDKPVIIFLLLLSVIIYFYQFRR